MSLTPDSDRPAPGGDMEQPRDEEGTRHVTLRAYLSGRYWGRFLLNGAAHAIILGVTDAIIPMLNWQLCLLALCNVALLSIGNRRQLVATLLILVLPAAGLQTGQMLDRPDDPRRIAMMFLSLALAAGALYLACSPRRRAPHHAVLDLPDGRQIPLLVGKVPCEEHPRAWHAVSGNGPIYLSDGWTIAHAGSRRFTVEPLVYHDDDGRAYVPDVADLRETL